MEAPIQAVEAPISAAVEAPISAAVEAPFEVPAAASSRSLLKQLGPGLITGASDDDPSGIATYSQVGAQFGYGMLWVMLFSYPLMWAIQEISARLGRVTGRGIAGNLRRYPLWLMRSIVVLLLIANTLNVGADLAAMGAATTLLIGGSSLLYATLFALVSLLLQSFMAYRKYANFLKWTTLTLLAYVAVVFVVHVPWAQALRATILPSVSLNAKFLTALIAVLGTTISPYLFFWQASQEAEEIKSTDGHSALKRAPEQAQAHFKRIRLDTVIGMALSNLVAFFIILTCAVTLHAHGTTDIETAAQAAQALRPIAGQFTFLLFGAGIIGTGLLAVPVLAGSAAYAVGEALSWRTGLAHQPRQAPRFYAVLAAATLVGLALNFTRIDPIKALFWSAVINGVVAVPVMVVMMLMASNPQVMGEFTVPRGLKIMGWLATAVMGAAALGMFATWGQ